jgi:hypothetical protein
MPTRELLAPSQRAQFTDFTAPLDDRTWRASTLCPSTSSSCLDRAITGFWLGSRRPSLHCPCSCFSINRVGFSPTTPILTLGPLHLDDLNSLPVQPAGEPCTIAAGPLDPKALQLAEAARPREQSFIASRRRWHGLRSQEAAELIQGCSNVRISVGIHADRNVHPRRDHCCHRVSSVLQVVAPTGRRRTALR